MKASQLIAALQAMPQDAEVLHLWDGEARTGVEFVWLSRDGRVITADYGMVCFSTETRPPDAPTKEEDRYWRTREDDEEA